MLFRHLPKKKTVLFLGDSTLIVLAILSTVWYRSSASFGLTQIHLKEILLVFTLYLVAFYLADLYDINAEIKSPAYCFRFIAGFSFATILLTLAFFFVPSLRPGRVAFTMTAVIIGIFVYLWRFLFGWLFRNFLSTKRRVLIIGAGVAGKALYDIIKNDSRYITVGFIDDDEDKVGVVNSPSVLGGSRLVVQVTQEQRVDVLAIAITDLRTIRNNELLKSVLSCKMRGVKVCSMPSLYEEITGKIPANHVSDGWFIDADISGVQPRLYTKKIKRLLDILLSSFGLIGCLPFFVMTAVAVKMDSKGPMFYRQKRVGINESEYMLVKFRSMRVDAEQDGPVWAAKEDGRRTRVGRVIRKLRIDEIPQMWNVLRGDMSFVGPRPERPEFVRLLAEKIPYYGLRHCVHPGITGWAQVNYPYGASKQEALEKLQYDLFYIKNLSSVLDFRILLRTVRTVLFGKGAR